LSLKIHWQIEDEQGVVPLRGGQAWVVHVDGLLDRLGRPPGEGEDGFTAGESDDRLALEATGDLSFVVGGKRGRKVLLPSGGQVEFEIAETVGTLRVSGETSAADPMVGREIGGFRLLGRLGSGAVGAVYRALQTSLDREVALKVLHPEASKDPVKVASFRGEAVAAGRLSHPNLVQVFDVADEGELHFFAMELVPGGTLEDKLRESGPLPWREAVLALRDTAQALSFAEAHELVHRDVKPENLMVTASGHVKLADLGLAATRGMIDQEAAGGTPHFMAPESIRPENVDHRSDLYSLGCTLFRLLTADTVFHGDSVRDILRAHREEAPPSLREAEVAAPRELEELLASLLAKDPDARPASALAVVEACERILAHRKQRRGAGIALVVLLAAAGAWAVLGPKDEAVEPPTPAVTGPSEEDRQRAEEQRLQQEGQRRPTGRPRPTRCAPSSTSTPGTAWRRPRAPSSKPSSAPPPWPQRVPVIPPSRPPPRPPSPPWPPRSPPTSRPAGRGPPSAASTPCPNSPPRPARCGSAPCRPPRPRSRPPRRRTPRNSPPRTGTAPPRRCRPWQRPSRGPARPRPPAG
jgi:serine/threonine protein kinase